MTKRLIPLAAAAFFLFASSHRLAAQAPDKERDAKASDSKDKCDAAATKEESSVTEHTIRIGGQTISYKATASTTLLKNDKGEPTGLDVLRRLHAQRRERSEPRARFLSLQRRTGLGHDVAAHGRIRAAPRAHRGRRRSRLLRRTSWWTTPRACSIRRTSFSSTPWARATATPSAKRRTKIFTGSTRTWRLSAQFIVTYLSRNDRWNSPKFLIGESYGTFRSAALGNYLQNRMTPCT